MLSEYVDNPVIEIGSVTPVYRYGVYGICLRSEIPLPLPEPSADVLADIELRTASAEWFTAVTHGAEIHQLPDSWYRFARLADGSSYARWAGVGEFLVPADGKLIFCRQFDKASSESL